MTCPNCDSCRLYHVFKDDETRSEIISEVCLDDDEYKECERFKRMSMGDKVPPTLMPDGSDLRHKKKEDK